MEHSLLALLGGPQGAKAQGGLGTAVGKGNQSISEDSAFAELLGGLIGSLVPVDLELDLPDGQPVFAMLDSGWLLGTQLQPTLNLENPEELPDVDEVEPALVGQADLSVETSVPRSSSELGWAQEANQVEEVTVVADVATITEPEVRVEEPLVMAQAAVVTEYQGAAVVGVNGESANAVSQPTQAVVQEEVLVTAANDVLVQIKPEATQNRSQPQPQPILQENPEGEGVPVLHSETLGSESQSGQLYLGKRSDLILLSGSSNQGKPVVSTTQGEEAPGPDLMLASNSLETVESQTIQAKQPPAEVVRGKFPEAFLEQVTKFSSLNAADGEKVIRIKLIPEELGEVRVELKLENGKVTGQIFTEQLATKELFAANLQQLRTTLQSQGVQVSNLLVAQGGAFQSGWDGFGERRAQTETGRKENRRLAVEDTELKVDSDLTGLQRTRVVTTTGGLDLRM